MTKEKNKIHFSRKERGVLIDNLTMENTGYQTGRYETDLYGTWYEVERDNGTKFWMIGEPKN